MDRGELGRRVTSGSLWTILAYGLNLPLGVVTNLVVANALGPEQFGRYASILVITGLLGVAADLGTGAALLQHGIASESTGSSESTRRLLAAAQTLRFVQAPLGLIAVVVLVSGAPGWLVIAYGAGTLLGAVVGNAPLLHQFRNLTARVARINLVVSGATSLAAMVAALQSADGSIVFLVRGVLAVASPVALFLCLSRSDRSMLVRPGSLRVLPEGFWRFALPTWLSSVFGMIVFSRSETALLRWLGHEADAGVFAVAFGLAMQATGPLDALAPVLLGALTSTFSSARNQVQVVVRRTAHFFSLFLAPVVLLLLCSPAVLPLIYGDGYREVGWLLLPLLVSSALQTLAHPVQAFAFAARAGQLLLWTNIVAAVVDIAVVLLLAPQFGAWGAVVANVAAQITALLILTRHAVQGIPVQVRALLITCAPLFLAFLIVAGIGSALAVLVPVSVPVYVAAAVLALVAWLGVVRIGRLGLTSDDADAMLRHAPAPVAKVGGLLLRVTGRRPASPTGADAQA